MPWPAVGGRWAAEINYFSKQNMAKVGVSKVVPLVVAAPSLSRAHSCLHLLLLLPALTWPKGYKYVFVRVCLLLCPAHMLTSVYIVWQRL